MMALMGNEAHNPRADQGLITPDEYLRILDAQLAPLPTERRRVAQSQGCVLAADVHVLTPTPAFTNSAMDGFACRLADIEKQGIPATMPVSADVPAGNPLVVLAPRTVARIMTGAPVPDGADTIVPVEDTNVPAGPRELPSEVRIEKAPKPGAHIRRAGEIMGAGEVVAEKGQVLTPFTIGGILSAGVSEVDVVPLPRVLVISTGAELLSASGGSASLDDGGTFINDSNGPMIAALLRQWGCTDVHNTSVNDDPEALAEVISDHAGLVDLVVTTGGVSAGAFDPLKMLADSGRDDVDLHFLKVAQQPGKPQGYGTIGDGRIMMLPGNPVSAFVSAWLYVRHVFGRLSTHPTRLAYVTGRMSASLGPFGGKRRFVPAVLRDGEFSLLGADRGFSHAASTLHRANVLLIVEPDTAATEGDEMRAIAIDRSAV
ncbi:Molybdopterin molybdenumtransferase 2 [Dietzia timorensis]|uniref:Molybdopterin molybdenumtransferase n=2 Tax=Dietzia timorensis TaxID=499555 RepID=A0A173LMN3_9ACTN|nr:Molybdopterin molybdenumtransferase 2 [Dietzia timorensis]